MSKDDFHRYKYTFTSFPTDDATTTGITRAANSLFNDISILDGKKMQLGPRYQRYLAGYQKNLVGALQKATFLLAHCLDGHKTTLSDYVFLDYGGGLGLQTFLAKRSGIGHVIYNDLNDDAVHAARVIGKALNCDVDSFIGGNADDLRESLEKEAIQINGTCSSNVIEHVYSLDDWFRELGSICAENASVVHATSVNQANARIRRRYMKIHLRDELRGRPARNGQPGFPPIVQQRQAIIREFASDLSQGQIEKLATLTRGKMRPDILKAIECFRATGELPDTPKHPTNTCCPNTGCWNDRLLDPKDVSRLLAEHGYSTKVLAGFYSLKGSLPLDFLRTTLNLGSRLMGSRSLRISPFWAVKGQRYSHASHKC